MDDLRALRTTPAPFAETIEGIGTNNVHVLGDEVVSISVTNPILGGGPQGVLDLRGVRRLIEALETAEKHLTYNQWTRR